MWMATPNCDFTCGRCSACTDIYPYKDTYTCEQQAEWGKCTEPFMTKLPHICDYSCGRCSKRETVYAKSSEIGQVLGYYYVDLPEPSEPECSDVYPYEDGYSCEEQARWGKCDEDFMRNVCDLSCQRCTRKPPADKKAAEQDSAGQEDSIPVCTFAVKEGLLAYALVVGACTQNNVGSMLLDLTSAPNNASIHVRFIDTAAAELVRVSFATSTPVAVFSITLTSQSGGNLQIANELNATMLSVQQLFLENLALTSKPNLTVRYCYINSSQDISTSLPTTTVEAIISALPSAEMLAVQELLTAVNIIPGAGQLAYSDDYMQACWHGADCSGIPGAAANLDFLSQAAPRLKWASPVIVWYGNSLHFDTMRVLPGEEHTPKEFRPSQWADYHVISKDRRNSPNYGSTVHDAEYLRYIQLLKANGYKVMVYPMLLLDLPGKPWRGHLTLRETADVARIFHRRHGYAEFILHYARLVKGHADAFVIGSEFKELTKSAQFVRCLVDLASAVKKILGAGVTVTYAADWSEYHHHDDGLRTLDALWASPHIDVVGIDAYFPLQEQVHGDSSVEDIMRGWDTGELWDFYYDKPGSRAPLQAEWAIKNLVHWWNNTHGPGSSWVPRMKPIWFTEFGFPSVHRSANQPNVFWNPDCSDGAVPAHSSGNVDHLAQTRGILATLRYWQNQTDIVQNMFLYAWDARPYPHFPRRLDLWSDGNQWSRGHWVNGKIEPGYIVTLRDADAALLTVYASTLELGPLAAGINVAQIVAATVRVVGDVAGHGFAVRCTEFIVDKPVVIRLSGGLKIECEDCDITFPSRRTTKRLLNSVDEGIAGSRVDVSYFAVKSRSLTLYSAYVVTSFFEVRTSGDFQLISEVEVHSRWWYSEGGRAYLLCGPRKKSGGSERNDVLRQTAVYSEDFVFEVKGRFHARAGLISTNTIRGYSMNFLFEPVSVEQHHHSWSKKSNIFRSRKHDHRSGGVRYDGAILLVADTAYIFSEVDITIIASTVVGDDVTLQAQTISLLAAVGKCYEHFRLTKKGILRMSTSAGDGEFSVSAGSYFHSQSRDSTQDVVYPTTISANKLTILARNLTVRGANIFGENVTIVADNISHQSVPLWSFQRYSETNIEVGIKIGFQERISAFVDSVTDMVRERDGGSQNQPTVVKAVNFVSKAKSLLRQAAAYNRAVTGGIWMYGDSSRSTQEQVQEFSLGNLLQATVLNVTAGRWDMENLHITGRDILLAVDTIMGHFAAARYRCRVSHDSVHGEFSLYGNTDSRLDAERSGVTSEGTSYTVNTIEATGKLRVEARNITGAFDMSGADVQILTDTLHLISKQDEASISAGSQSVSASLSGTFGGHASRSHQRSKITDRGLSRIVGRDILLVNATGAIHLVGAYLDSSSGNLTVFADEIKAYTLHDYVSGSSAGLGASIDLNGDISNRRVTVGDTDLHRAVYGAIGAGMVVVGGKEIDLVLGSLGELSRSPGLKDFDGHRWEMNVDLGAVNLDPLFGDAKDNRDFPMRLADAITDSLTEAVNGMAEGIVELGKQFQSFTTDSNAGQPESVSYIVEDQRRAAEESAKAAQTARVKVAVTVAKESIQKEELLDELEVEQILHDTLSAAQYNIGESQGVPTAVLPFGAPACVQSSTCLTKVKALYDEVVREVAPYYQATAAFVRSHPQLTEAVLTIAELAPQLRIGVKTLRGMRAAAKIAPSVRAAAVGNSVTHSKGLGSVVVRRSTQPTESKLQYMDKPGRVTFNGIEFRGVRQLRHLSNQELQHMATRGTNPRDLNGNKLVYHHHQQKDHREAGSFVVELPADAHSIGQKVQHPLGNKDGISKDARADWNKVRVEINKQRARDELRLRKSPGAAGS